MSAAPLCTSFSNLQQYIDQGSTGCSIDGNLFRDFDWRKAGGGNVNAKAAAVAVEVIDENERYGLRFSSPEFTQTKHPGTGKAPLLSYFLSYSVDARLPLEGVEARVNDAVTTGNGEVTVTKAITHRAGTETLLLGTHGASGAFATLEPDAGLTLGMRNLIVIHAGTTGSGAAQASAGSIENLFVPVPEPIALLMAGSGLIGLGLLARRRMLALHCSTGRVVYRPGSRLKASTQSCEQK